MSCLVPLLSQGTTSCSWSHSQSDPQALGPICSSSRRKWKEQNFRASAVGLPCSNRAGQKMLMIPNFHSLLFLSISKPPNPVVDRLPAHPMSSCICAFFLLLTSPGLFASSFRGQSCPWWFSLMPATYLNCFLLPVLAFLDLELHLLWSLLLLLNTNMLVNLQF